MKNDVFAHKGGATVAGAARSAGVVEAPKVDLDEMATRSQGVLDTGRFRPRDEEGLERLARRYYFSMALPASYYPKKYEDRWQEWAIEQGVSRAYIAMLDGDAIGVHPSMAIRQIHVINGVPTMSADLMFGRLLATGLLRRDDFSIVATKTECVLTIGIATRKPDARMAISCKYEDFKHLHGKDNWRNDPEAMLVARAKSRAVRRYAPDLLVGVYSTEEMQDARASAAVGVYEVPAEFMPGGNDVPIEPPPVPATEQAQGAPAVPVFDREAGIALLKEIRGVSDAIEPAQIEALRARVKTFEGTPAHDPLVEAWSKSGVLNPAQVAP